VNSIHLHSKTGEVSVVVTNFKAGEKHGWQSVRIRVAGVEISIIGENGQNVAGDISNALIGGLLDIQEG
jgi:hypothetical protein